MILTSQRNTASEARGNINDTNTTFICNFCKKRSFTSYKGLNIHIRACLKKVNAVSTTTSSQPVLTRNEQSEDADSNVSTFKWGDASGNKFSNDLNFIYDKIVYWKKNLFLLPSGSVGEKFHS